MKKAGLVAALLLVPTVALAAQVRNLDSKAARITVKSGVSSSYTIRAGGTQYGVCGSGGTISYKKQSMPCSADSRHKIQGGRLSAD